MQQSRQPNWHSIWSSFEFAFECTISSIPFHCLVEYIVAKEYHEMLKVYGNSNESEKNSLAPLWPGLFLLSLPGKIGCISESLLLAACDQSFSNKVLCWALFMKQNLKFGLVWAVTYLVLNNNGSENHVLNMYSLCICLSWATDKFNQKFAIWASWFWASLT